MKRRLFLLSLFLFLFYVLLLLPNLFMKGTKNSLVIGSKNNTECRILAEIMAELIEQKTTIPIRKSLYLEGTFIAYEAMRSGSIDLYVDYTGTLLLAVLKEDSSENAKKDLEKVQKAMKQDHIVVLPPFGFSNSYSLIVHGDAPYETISDIVGIALRGGFDPEFIIRPEFRDLQRCYQMKFSNYKIMDQALLYLALKNKSIDVIDGDQTDGKIEKYHLKILKDDRKCLPQYEATVLIRKKALDRFPQIRQVLEPLFHSITNKDMQEMNFSVDSGKTPKDVAKEFLQKRNL